MGESVRQGRKSWANCGRLYAEICKNHQNRAETYVHIFIYDILTDNQNTVYRRAGKRIFDNCITLFKASLIEKHFNCV